MQVVPATAAGHRRPRWSITARSTAWAIACQTATSIDPVWTGLGVQSRHLMGWIEDEAVGLLDPDFPDVLVGRESVERFEAPIEVVGGDEVDQVSLQLLMVVVVITLHGRFLESAVRRPMQHTDKIAGQETFEHEKRTARNRLNPAEGPYGT